MAAILVWIIILSKITLRSYHIQQKFAVKSCSQDTAYQFPAAMGKGWIKIAIQIR